MADFMVFQLYGAMASWGDIAVGEYRPSLGHPTKSAVMGLLAAALGLDRSEDEQHRQLSQGLGVGVCVRAAGEIMRDYHTVQVPGGKRDYTSRKDELGFNKLNLNTILSQRDYRTDAYCQVAVWLKEPNALQYDLQAIKAALEAPVFPLYLGRKSCAVSLPLAPCVFLNTNLKQAFTDYPVDKAELSFPYLTKPELISYYWEPLEDSAGMEATMTYPRRDQVHSRKRWQFANRDEFYYAEPATGGA